MSHTIKLSDEKKVYTVFSDNETRGFLASLRRLQKDCADAEAGKRSQDAAAAIKSAEDTRKAAKKAAADLKRKAAKKAEAKPEAEAAQRKAAEAAAALEAAKKAAQEAQRIAAEAIKRHATPDAAAALKSLAYVMQAKEFAAADITKDFLLKWLPRRFNESQQLCSVKAIKPEDEADTRKKYADFPQLLIETEGILYIYRPIALFTANTFLSLFCSAADARRKAGKEKTTAAEKEAKRIAAEEKEAKRIAAYKAKIAAYYAKHPEAATK